MREITIAGRKLGDGHEPFIVAEVGVNHNGSVERALRMVHIAAAAGCDACKFGTFKAAEFCAPDDPLFDMFKAAELPDTAWREIKAECDKAGVIFFSTPQNVSDFDVLMKVGVPAIKVGSDDLTNIDLIERYTEARLPIILSTGMADELDVWRASETVRMGRCALLVLVCTSEYPCPPEHANVARIKTLREILPTVPIGFSDHTVGPQAAGIAAALGCAYFEKHFTMSNDLPGPDHHFSANPEQLANWAWAIRHALTMLGDGAIGPTAQEQANRTKWRRKSGQQIRGDGKEAA